MNFQKKFSDSESARHYESESGRKNRKKLDHIGRFKIEHPNYSYAWRRNQMLLFY